MGGRGLKPKMTKENVLSSLWLVILVFSKMDEKP